MLPVKALRLSLGETLAADPATLAPVALGNKIALVANAFTEDENLDIPDFTLATFTGSAPKVLGTGTQPVGLDPATGEQIITMLEPAGGLRWECTATPATPENIFGFILMDNAGAVLLAMHAFPTPITISEAGQEINLGAATLILVLQPMS